MKRKMAMLTHAHCKKENGHGNSRPSRKGKRAGKGTKYNARVRKAGIATHVDLVGKESSPDSGI